MTLRSIQKDYADLKINKIEFIDQMHAYHQVLHEYSDFVKGTDISKIEISDGQIIMTDRETGIRMICNKDDKRIAPYTILNFGSYEPDEAWGMRSLIDPGNTIFDVGANIGYYSMSLSRLVPNLKIFAFEPIERSFAYLTQHLEMNQINNVQAFQFGLSDKKEEKVFYFSSEGSVNASAALMSDKYVVHKMVCQVETMDEFTKSKGTTVDFIKVDVEGAELFVFQGGLKTIATQKPVIFSEMLRKWSAKFNYHPNEIIQLLADLGYGCFTVNARKLARFHKMDENTVETNFFFLHLEKHQDKIKKLS